MSKGKAETRAPTYVFLIRVNMYTWREAKVFCGEKVILRFSDIMSFSVQNQKHMIVVYSTVSLQKYGVLVAVV